MGTLEIFLLVVIGMVCLAALTCWVIVHQNREVSARKLWLTPFAFNRTEFFNEKGNRFRKYYWVLVTVGSIVALAFFVVMVS